jgi:hypothetical protein
MAGNYGLTDKVELQTSLIKIILKILLSKHFEWPFLVQNVMKLEKQH